MTEETGCDSSIQDLAGNSSTAGQGNGQMGRRRMIRMVAATGAAALMLVEGGRLLAPTIAEATPTVPRPETFNPVGSYVAPYPKNETDWHLTQGARGSKGPHFAWEWDDGYNGVADDFAPAAPSNGAAIRTDRNVLPMAGGKVIRINSSQYWLAIDHGNGDIGFYLHVANIKVSENANISANTPIGNPSRLGFNATGVHVHVAIAKYARSAPPRVGLWNPNNSWWSRSFPGVRGR